MSLTILRKYALAWQPITVGVVDAHVAELALERVVAQEPLALHDAEAAGHDLVADRVRLLPAAGDLVATNIGGADVPLRKTSVSLCDEGIVIGIYLRSLCPRRERDDRAELVGAAVLDGDVVTVGTVFLDQVFSNGKRNDLGSGGFGGRVIVGDGDDIEESILGRGLGSEDTNIPQFNLWRG